MPECAAGDCRAVLLRGSKAVQLTTAHTADDDQERARMLSCDAEGVRRVGMGSRNGWRVGLVGLQVTRWAGTPACAMVRRLTLMHVSILALV